MNRLDENKKDSRKIIWKSLWSAAVLVLGVTILIFVTLTISRLLEGRSSEKSGQEIKLKVEEKSSWSGSQISPLHRIPLMDEFNQKIIPAAPDSLPFSARYTCGPCHDYDRISGGTHFNFRTRPETDRITEPWVVVEEKAGVQLSISFQNYPGLWSPEKLRLSAWQFVNLFGRNLNGGGPGEPTEKEITPDSHWNVSGQLEINCLGCHNKSYLQDHTEWTKQVMRQNFRWAATAASGLGEVAGMASRLPSTWDVIDGPNPDDHEWAVAPQVKYNQSFFDSKNNAVLDLAHQPDDNRCLACHSVTLRKAETKASTDRDVHSMAGLKCADCHRNDISHQMIRGFEGQKLSNSGLQPEDFTCAGCHLGKNPEKGGEGYAGKLGAPKPAHKDIPKVHFERLSCTACHSGPLPEKEPQEVYTSRANRLGVFGKALWTSEYPVIQEPVFVREKDGKIYPERVIWPAFWAEKKGKELVPVDSQEILNTAPEVFQLKENVASLLNSLLPLAEEGFYPAVVISKYLFEPNVDGSLDVRPLEKSPLLGKASQGKFVLVQVKKDEVKPLLPAFNPEEAPAELEDKILRVLQALKSQAEGREPALVVGKFIYRITEGYLDKTEKGGEPAAEPEIGWPEEENLRPLLSDFQVRTLEKLNAGQEILTEEQVVLVLEKLSRANPQKEFAYVAAGRVFSLGKDRKLKVSEHPEAKPVFWPLAHNVRPAQQALGKNGCTDCHSPDSRVFFGKVEASSPLKTASKESKLQADWMKTGTFFQLLFGFTFLVRPAFKLLLAACLLLIGLILLVVVVRITGKITGIKDNGQKPESRR
jgi:hypothetical protein